MCYDPKLFELNSLWRRILKESKNRKAISLLIYQSSQITVCVYVCVCVLVSFASGSTMAILDILVIVDAGSVILTHKNLLNLLLQSTA